MSETVAPSSAKAPSYAEMTQNLRAPKGWLTTFLEGLTPGEPKEFPYTTPSTGAMAKAAATKLGFRVAVMSHAGSLWVTRVVEPSKVPFEPSMSYHVSPVSDTTPTPITSSRSRKKVETIAPDEDKAKEPIGFATPQMPKQFDA